MKTVHSIVKNNLCIGCGFCPASCPTHAISMTWNGCGWEPKIDDLKCIYCGKCVIACPNNPETLVSDFKRNKTEKSEGLLTNTCSYIAYDLVKEGRKKSASGGMLTALNKYLLESGCVDGIVCSAGKKASFNQPHADVVLITDLKDLEETRSSRYHPHSYHEVLETIAAKNGVFACVGVPCIMRAIDKLPDSLKTKIKFKLCLACSHNVCAHFSDYLAKHAGVKKKEEYSIDFRDKTKTPNANAFNIVVEVDKKRIIENRFKNPFTIMWRNYAYAFEGCLFCPDFLGFTADLTVKDAWGILSADPSGHSLIKVQNTELNKILIESYGKSAIWLKKISTEDFIQSQSKTIYFKKDAVGERFYLKKIFGRQRPFIKNLRNKDFLQGLYLLMMAKLSHRFPKTVYLIARFVKPFIIFLIRSTKFLKRIIAGISYSFLHPVCTSLRYIITIPKKQSKQTPSVLILGGYGYKNEGDEAQLAHCLEGWQKLYPEISLIVASPNPEYTQKTHGVLAVSAPRNIFFKADRYPFYSSSNIWFKIRYLLNLPRWLLNAHLLRLNTKFYIGLNPQEQKLFSELERASVIHFTGGGYLTGMTLSRLWDGLLIIKICSILKKPVLLTGQTIGIFKDPISKILARWFRYTSHISLRDPEESIRELKKIGIPDSKMTASFDDALFCQKSSEDMVNAFLKECGISHEDKYVSVNLHYWGQNEKYKYRIIHTMASICDEICSRYNLKILFIPMHASDMRAINDINLLMNEVAHTLPLESDYKMIKGVIARAQLCLTMKHHPIIFALGTGCPTIAISFDDYYLRKNKGALDLFGMGDFLFQQEDFFEKNKILHSVDCIISNQNQYKEKIKSVLDRLKSKDFTLIQNFKSSTIKNV